MNNLTINTTSHNSFLSNVEDCLRTGYIQYSFLIGDIKILAINDKTAFLWQNPKGEVKYSFNLLDKEIFTTSIIKIGNSLSSHFGCTIEAHNNPSESLKKVTHILTGLNKSIKDAQLHQDYLNYSSEYESNGQVLQTSYSGNLPAQQLMHNQTNIHNNLIKLSLYQYAYNQNTIIICINELPIVHKEVFAPYKRIAFFTENNLFYRNTYIPSEYMVKNYDNKNMKNSFIMSLLLFMANNDSSKAIRIFSWIADIFALNKLPCALVLYAKDDVYMKLLFEEILVPLLNVNHCELIENSDLNKKSLSSQLHNKVLYNFHNITKPTILEAPSKDFTNRLLHKNSSKVNNKMITTLANVLITSTTNYLPLIANDVPSIAIEIASDIDDFCKKRISLRTLIKLHNTFKVILITLQPF